MKRLLLALSAILLFTSTHANARDIWRGMMVIKTSTSGCQDIVAGSEFTVRYSPKTPDNGNNSKISLFSQFSGSDWAQSLELLGREFDSTLRPVEVASIWAGPRGITSTSTNPPAVKVAFSTIKRTPGANKTTAATEFLEISGSIADFYSIYYSNCNVTFRMALVRAEPL